MLRLEVDARLLRAGGIGRFIRETTSRWMKSRSVVALRLLGRPEELEPWLLEVEGADLVEIVPWRARPYHVSGQVQWLTDVRNGRGWEPDVTLFPHYDIPIVRHPRPSVTVVHDLIHLELPDLFPAWKRLLASGLLRRVGSESECIVTVSSASRFSLSHFFGDRAQDIHVVPNGVSDIFRPLGRGEHDRAMGRSPSMLCVSPDRPHKNLTLALRVLSALPEQNDWRLIIVGLSSDELGAVGRRCGCQHLLHRVELPGRVSDAELRRLYCEASVVLVPSFLEGFALPAYEARACGTPVLALHRPWSEDLESIGVQRIVSSAPEVWAQAVSKVHTKGARSGEALTLETVPRWDVTAELLLRVLEARAGRDRDV
ncbi:MAG: glycosyltransferase family 1 protein [Longimicrobiales bacterium]|nr:glycosyltransferase family 1 protein [Longimicrobiales bacterium]